MEKVLKERQRFGRFYYRFPNGEAVSFPTPFLPPPAIFF